MVGGAGFDLQAFGKYGDWGGASTLKSRDWKDATDLVVQTTPGASASFDGNDVSATLHKPNGTPGYSDQELFAQQGAYLARCLDMTHADEVIREVDGGVTPTMQSRMGTGGNQVPLVIGFSHVASGMMLDCQPSPTSVPLKRSHGGEGAVCVEVDTYNQSISPNVMHTLHHHDGLDNQPKVAYPINSMVIGKEAKDGDRQTTGIGGENDPCQTLQAGHHHAAAICVSFDGRKDAPVIPECAHTECVGTNPGFKNGVALRHIVRRLAPTERERLQAFPDGWTRIPYRGKPADQCPDSPRYKAIGNSWATNCAEWILRRIVAAVRLGLIPEEETPCQ
jgi:DNA (cytosine-5)-methyltransferase 1